MKESLRCYRDGVAIVTGAASGIGLAIAQALCARGCRVVLADIDLQQAEEAAEDLRRQGHIARAVRLDVSRPEEVNEVVASTVDEFGRLDYLFNNAGVAIFGEVLDYTHETWNRILGINLGGVINGIQAAYPVMVRQGFGHIVNTASITGLYTAPGIAGYSITKHAVVSLSNALRLEAHSRGVRVSALCPGAIRTPILGGGRHGIFVGPVSEAAHRERSAKFFESMRPMDPSALARAALKRVAANRAIIILPGWNRIFWWLERLSPALSCRVARMVFEFSKKSDPDARRSPLASTLTANPAVQAHAATQVEVKSF